MDKKTKNLFKAITGFAALAMTIGLVTTLSVGEKEKEFICETDRLLDGYTLKTTDNAYPNDTTINEVVYPEYSTGLEYSVDTTSGQGTLLSPYKAAVARGSCTDTDVKLPEYYYDGTYYYKVTAIDQDGFNAQKPIKDANGSVLGCYDLSTITSLKEFELVGSQAFAYTTLSSVEFSSNLAELSPSTFFHCKNLRTTDFIQLEGEAASTTGTYAAFSSVGNNCFADCIKYEGMLLPRTLTNIGDGAYQNCTSMTSVFLPATDIVGEHLEVGDYAFAGCTRVTVVYISSKVERIGAHAFEGCTNAKGYSALSFSDLVTQLGESGNGDWNYLFNDGTYDSEGTNDTFLDFSGRDSKGDLRYDQPYFYSFNSDGEGGEQTVTLDLYDGSEDPDVVFLRSDIRTIPSTRGAGYKVTRIGEKLFKDNTAMEHLIVPPTVKMIGRAAFAGCTNLQTVSLSSGLKVIDDYAFAPWNGEAAETRSNYLTSLEIPKTVETIGDFAFPYMYDIMNITFLGSKDDTSDLKHIGRYAFYKAGWSYKDTHFLGGSYAEVRNALILNMHPQNPDASSYKEATQDNYGRPLSTPDTYTEICDFAFYGNQWIGSIRIASDRLVVDGFVFANCYWLVEADLGEGLKIMGNGKNKNDDRNGRGRTFSIAVNESSINTENNINDLGGNIDDNRPTDPNHSYAGQVLQNDCDANIKPYVPMSSLYLPLLNGRQYVGQGTLSGRYQTMVFTKGTGTGDNSKYLFQWSAYNGNADIEPTYLDRGSPACSSVRSLGNEGKFSNDQNKAGYSGFYGVDNSFGSSYNQETFTGDDYFYQIKQGGYYGVTFGHATVTENEGTYSATYKDDTGADITSINNGKRYAFTYYDPDTGRPKFDFVQTAAGQLKLILAKFHYNPYWEQSKDVVVPQNVTFGGTSFEVSEIGNCAFFRNICPQTHAWVGDNNNNPRVYVSPQGDNHTTNPNKDYLGNYYSDYNNDLYNLESVVLPNTIKRIGGNAFYMCAGLHSLKTDTNGTLGAEGRFPSGITAIQQYAFSFTGLTTVSLPNTIQTLGNPSKLCNPFASCLSLTSISIDAGGSYFKTANGYITSTNGQTIYMSPLGTASTSIVIPSTVKTLGSLSFRGARQITTVEIPSGLTKIEAGCFDNIDHGEIRKDNKDRPDKIIKGLFKRRKSQLQSITVTGGARSGLTSIGAFAFYHCEAFHGIDFPNNLTTIGDRAFYYCSTANNYYIPNSLTSVGVQAFYQNTAFNTIRTDGKPNGETQGYLNLAATSLKKVNRNAFNIGNANFDTISFPKTLTNLDEGVLFDTNYSSVATVYMHNNTVSMNSALFQSNGNLTTFKTWTGDADAQGQIPNGNISTGNALPTNLTKIGSNCFKSCSKFTGFSSFPATLTNIGESSFNGCSNANFTSVDFSNSTADLTLGSNAFSNCTKVTSLTFVDSLGSRDKANPNSTLRISTGAFNNCTGLTSYVILPRGTTADSGAFSNSNITAIYVCDVYDDAKNKVLSSAAANTHADVYYYADNVGDKGTAPGGTLFWRYTNNVPEVWVPA